MLNHAAIAVENHLDSLLGIISDMCSHQEPTELVPHELTSSSRCLTHSSKYAQRLCEARAISWGRFSQHRQAGSNQP